MNVLGELRARQRVFHRPELGCTRADFERMTDPGFWEIGASGRRYDRAFVLDELERRYANGPYPDRWEVRDFASTELAPNTHVATYTLVQDGSAGAAGAGAAGAGASGRVTRRSTIWRLDGEGWKAVYHQGTPVSE